MRDNLCFITACIIGVALLVFVANELSKYSCEKTAESLGYPCEYSIWTSCIVTKPDGKKILLEQLRNFEK